VKLGVTSAAYRAALRAGALDLGQWIETCARDLDVDGVEFAADALPSEPRALREIKRACVERQLTIAGVGLDADLCEETTRPREIERVRQACDVAAYIGAPVLRITAGEPRAVQPARDDGRIIGLFRKVFGERQIDRRRLWSDVMWALRGCADYAAERGTVIAVQNGEQQALIHHGPALAQAVRDVGSPWLRCCPDPASMPVAGGFDVAVATAAQVRVLLRRVLDDGADATLYLPETLRMLRLGGYRGFVILDYAGAEDVTSAMPRAARYVRGVLQLLQRQHLLEETRAGNGRSPYEAAEAVRRAVREPVQKA